jgi:mono/diheme cytochrome c family protein
MVKGDGARPRRWARLVPAAAIAAALALTAGCGGESERDGASTTTARRVVEVQQVKRDRWTYARARFNEMCAGCHSLADAGATGPRFNLDHTIDVTESRARHVIAEGEPGMPRFRDVLSKREYEELVAYVSTVDQHTPGEDDWQWQIRLRNEGERWSPKDAR